MNATDLEAQRALFEGWARSTEGGAWHEDALGRIGLTYEFDSVKSEWEVWQAALAAQAQVVKQEPVAGVVGRIGDTLRIGWLRPENVKVGSLLYASPFEQSPVVQQSPPAIGSPFNGGIYAGIIRGVSGQPDAHLIVLPEEAEGLNWEDAVAFAAAAGGDLPTRREQAILYVNVPELFQPDWYWSGEQHASNPASAWFQYFDRGYQTSTHKSAELRTVAVRRVSI
jgi:hypothetical protein